MDHIKQSVVELKWNSNKKEIIPVPVNTGVICGRLKNGSFLVLSTTDQLKRMIEENVDMNDIIGRVKLGNGTEWIIQDGKLDFERQLCLVNFTLSQEAASTVKVATFSLDNIYANQQICTIHHPILKPVGQPEIIAEFQYTQGFVADPGYEHEGVSYVHAYLPSVMKGSFGAPLFDKHSNKIIGMIQRTVAGKVGPDGYEQFPEHRVMAATIAAIDTFVRLHIPFPIDANLNDLLASQPDQLL